MNRKKSNNPIGLRHAAGMLLCLAVLAGLSSGAVAAQQNHLSDIRFWSAPTFTRIVFDLQQETQPDASTLADPDRIAVVMSGFDGFLPRSLLSINDGIVRNVRALQDRDGNIRVLIELEKPATHKIFSLRPIDGKSPRLVVDVTRLDLEQADRRQREETRLQKKTGDYIIVVDPGHGGEDPGAVSKKGTQEKDLVLAIGRKLVGQLERTAGIKAYLTRTGDYFIPLQKRIEIAKEYGADVFVSVHVNAGFSPKVSGSSVYCLSFKGASSNVATMAAQRENASDSIGGVSLDGQESGVNAILYDMVQTHTLNTSVRLAELLLSDISKFNKLYSATPQQANFAVLRSLDIPSVLIETDFISTPERERSLKTEGFQNEFAKTVAAAVRTYVAGTDLRPQAPASPEQTARSDLQPPSSGKSSAAASGLAQSRMPRAGNNKAVEQPAAAVPTKQAAAGGTKTKTPHKPLIPEPVQGYRVVKKSETEFALVPVAGAASVEPRDTEMQKKPAAAPKKTAQPVQQKKGRVLSAAPEAQVTVHVVRQGETIFTIARMYDLPVDELKKLNGMISTPELRTGAKIKVPALATKTESPSRKNS
jgi:N-acetylmuramoyl-L-alanine amidase